MAAWRYEISLLVLKYFSTREEKFRIFARLCSILYVKKIHDFFYVIIVNAGDFLNRLKASEGEDTVVNSIGDVLQQQVRKKGDKWYCHSVYTVIKQRGKLQVLKIAFDTL